MGRLVVDMFVTLDGVAQAPGGPDEDREEGFPYGGWQAQFLDRESLAYIGAGIERMDALLLGRKTYDIFADYWPKAPADDVIGRKLNAVRKYVAARTLERVEWNNTRLIETGLVEAVRQIKHDHQEIHVIGSVDLVQSLLREGLVDRFVLLVYPVVLGTGKRLFADGLEPQRLKLVESRGFPNGAVLMVYEPAGKPTYATITLEGRESA